MSRKARYESTQGAESKGKKRLGDFARGAAQAPPCAEKNDALQDPADQRENHQKDKPPRNPSVSRRSMSNATPSAERPQVWPRTEVPLAPQYRRAGRVQTR